MRWREARFGDKRRFTKFLLLPRCIEHECRWLEWATIEQELLRGHRGGLWWTDMRWINN